MRKGLKREIFTHLREEFKMRRSKTKTILTACEMSFAGNTDSEIASDLGTSVSAVSRWRKNEVWQSLNRNSSQRTKRHY